jgi:hypothetical protein
VQCGWDEVLDGYDEMHDCCGFVDVNMYNDEFH